MKHILLGVVGAAALMIISLSSCKKEDVYPVISSKRSPDLVANNWVNYGGPIYVNTFKDIIPPDPSGNRKVRIYLDDNGRLKEISSGHINYMGNDLWATNTQVDIDIMYRCKGKLPFTELHIRYEIDSAKFY